MKEEIQQLIEQHKLFKQEAEMEYQDYPNDELLNKEIEMRTLFISELQELLSF